MRLFKAIFYPVYLIVIAVVLLMAFNIYDALELMKRWGWYKYFSDLPILGRNIMIFLCALMLIELSIENISLFIRRRKINKLLNEVKELKVKLFDESTDSDSASDKPSKTTSSE